MRRTLLILLALGAATVAAYWGVLACGFVAYDDPSYVCRNPMVNQGVREAAIYWAFTAMHGGNWHPLTTLSHMLDCTLFGLNAGAQHGVNLALHTLDALLVFLVWKRLGSAERGTTAALVAGWFALHPLHVESVAWISERKDVLSTALWLLTLLAYLRYVERRSRRSYALVVLGTALAMMSKPMTITLPCTLLLLDYWPLARWRERGWGALLREKAPLFMLAAALGAATVRAQHAAEATDYGARLDLGMRLGNAAVAYARYLGKMLWPGTLSPLYPHPGAWPWWTILGALASLGAVSWLAWRERTRRPWLAFGWCWYLGTLVPVIGLVQVGAQAIADRYTYVPLLGIFTIVAWAGAELAERRPAWRGALAGLAALTLGACWWGTARQVPVWADGLRLAEQMRATAGEHVLTYREMAVALNFAGRPESEVNAQYRRALELDPTYPFALNELALSAARAGRFDEALALMGRLRDALPLDPAAWTNLGSVHLMAGNLDDARRDLRRAVELDPRQPAAHRLLAQAWVREGRFAEARGELETAVRCDHWDWQLHNELGVVYFGLDRYSDGIASLEHALWIHPRDEATLLNLAAAREHVRR